MRSTAGPSATDRKIAMQQQPDDRPDEVEHVQQDDEATSVKNTRTIVRVLSCDCPATVSGSV